MAVRLVLCVACALLVAGCGGSSGGHTVTMTMQMPNADDPMGHAFAAAVARRTDGAVRVLARQDRRYDSRWPANEVRLARDLQAGRVDAGYLPARAWAAEGNGAFQALLAPFVVTTNPTAYAVAHGPIAARVLATLPGSVVGLSLVPSALRRFVSARRLPTTAAAFRGMRVRVIDNPQTEADVRALGAIPVRGVRSDVLNGWFDSGRLDAAETSPTFALGFNYVFSARYLTSYAVAPKFQSVVFNARAWRALSPRQQAAVRAAARDAVTMARRVVPGDEQREMTGLCAGGMRIAVPTTTGLRRMAAMAARANARLDPAGRGILSALRRLPGAGPRAMASAIPAACRTAR